jgi:hypothetical protein
LRCSEYVMESELGIWWTQCTRCPCKNPSSVASGVRFQVTLCSRGSTSARGTLHSELNSQAREVQTARKTVAIFTLGSQTKLSEMLTIFWKGRARESLGRLTIMLTFSLEVELTVMISRSPGMPSLKVVAVALLTDLALTKAIMKPEDLMESYCKVLLRLKV